MSKTQTSQMTPEEVILQNEMIPKEAKLKIEETPEEVKQKNERLLEALRQNWLHVRHLETERWWFTNIYAVIVAGTLALPVQRDIKGFSHLISFLLVLSILGLLVVLKTSQEFTNHMKKIQEIIKDLNLDNYLALPIAYKEDKSAWKIIRVRYAFTGFYFATMLLLLYLLFFPR